MVSCFSLKITCKEELVLELLMGQSFSRAWFAYILNHLILGLKGNCFISKIRESFLLQPLAHSWTPADRQDHPNKLAKVAAIVYKAEMSEKFMSRQWLLFLTHPHSLVTWENMVKIHSPNNTVLTSEDLELQGLRSCCWVMASWAPLAGSLTWHNETKFKIKNTNK